MVLEKILESPLACKEIHPVHPKGDKIVPLPPTRTGQKSHLSFTWCVANHGAPSVRAPVGATEVLLWKRAASFALCQAGYKDLGLQDKAKDFGFSPCFSEARSLLEGSLGLGHESSLFVGPAATGLLPSEPSILLQASRLSTSLIQDG